MRIQLRNVETMSGDIGVHELNQHFREVHKVINGRIGFGDGTSPDNLDIDFVTITNAAGYVADAEITVSHALRRVPVGYIVYSQSVAGSLYNSSTTWTTTKLYLKFNVGGASTIKIMVF